MNSELLGVPGEDRHSKEQNADGGRYVLLQPIYLINSWTQKILGQSMRIIVSLNGTCIKGDNPPSI